MTVVVLGLLACQSGGFSDSGVEDCGVTWDGWAHGFFTTYCATCHSEHSPDRYGAPTGVDFGSVEEVSEWLERIRVRVLEEETMPVGGGVPLEDLELLDRYLTCLEGA